MKRQIALLALVFAVLTLFAQGQNNPDLGVTIVKAEHNQMPILLEGSGQLMPESIIKGFISDEGDEDDDDDDLDELELFPRSKRGR
jgi:hypothetical protein